MRWFKRRKAQRGAEEQEIRREIQKTRDVRKAVSDEANCVLHELELLQQILYKERVEHG